jgi:hypothetical protein
MNLNRQNAKHATRAAKGHVRTSCAIIFAVPFGAGAQQLLRFGGSKNVLPS